jgi:hypothetical protein
MVGLRDGPMKFISELDSGRAKLFDVVRDPDERRNIAGLHVTQVGEYERTLRGWSAAQKQRLRTCCEFRNPLRCSAFGMFAQPLTRRCRPASP